VIKKILKNEKGQLLPFIAVIMILLILFTALQFALSMAYLSRIKARDALDSAVLSAASIAERQTRPTFYGEKKVVRRNSDGSIEVVWIKTTSNYKPYLYLSRSDAIEIAEEYFIKNLKLSNLKGYRILDLDITIKNDENNPIQVVKRRPVTEGIVDSWEENFPRWVRVEASAKVELPAPLGGILGRDTVVVELKANSRKHLLGIPLEGVWN
jgi:hypothetical protein